MTSPLGHNEILGVTDKGPKPPVHPYTGRNRAERRQLARKNGWKGAKAKKGQSMSAALRQAEQAAEQQAQAERVAKIQQSAARARALGLVLPGQ